jgi:hypothetical protein
MGIFRPLKEQESAIFDRIVQHPSQKLPKSQPAAARTVTVVLRITIEAFSIITEVRRETHCDALDSSARLSVR